MAITAEEVAKRYPIHWLVWNNNHEELRTSLESNKFTPEDLELKDPRGRTPLLLAVTLGYIEIVRLLIDTGVDVNCEKDGWTAVQEATATGDAELLSLVLSRRDYQRLYVRAGGIPELLHRLSLAPDFYVEMKWEFTSWVPLVSRMCPFDTYKVYKRGGNVRVDTTLVGFENNRWQRGDRTYIFRGTGRTASLMELDHEAGTSWCEYLEPLDADAARSWPAPPAHALQQRLASPLAINYLDTDKISFERNKSGIWGWRQDKTENVNGYECKVFSANNVELVSKTRTEHLPKGEKAKVSPRAPLAGLLALAEPTTPTGDNTPLLTPDKGGNVNGYECKVFSANNVEIVSKTRTEHLPKGEKAKVSPRAPLAGLLALAEPTTPTGDNTPLLTPDKEQPPSRSRSRENLSSASGSTTSVSSCSWQEYFSGEPLDHDIGKPREIATKVQKFKATLWLCEDYPLELQEQIMPILDLMAAISSPHFAKLKDFIQMQLPAGFPVKIEIPLFHVLNARITFGNIFATETQVPHIECIQEGTRLSCVVDDACFSVGRGYRDAAHVDRLAMHLDDEEGLLQYAIQQSLMEAGTSDEQVDVWEALRGARPCTPTPRAHTPPHHDAQLQRAIEASLRVLSVAEAEPEPLAEADRELQQALALSAREQARREQELLADQRALDEALRLSLLDN